MTRGSSAIRCLAASAFASDVSSEIRHRADSLKSDTRAVFSSLWTPLGSSLGQHDSGLSGCDEKEGGRSRLLRPFFLLRMERNINRGATAPLTIWKSPRGSGHEGDDRTRNALEEPQPCAIGGRAAQHHPDPVQRPP